MLRKSSLGRWIKRRSFWEYRCEELKVCSRNWIYPRSAESSGSNLKFDKPETQEAVSMILKYAKDKEKGSFNPFRERDELSRGLGNKEHIGRTRG